MVVTEVMVLAIVLGAALVFLVRQRSNSSAGAAAGELAKDAAELKQELQRTGDEIITSLGGHIARLESLVKQADERAKKLQEEEERLSGMQLELAQQIAEGHMLQQRMKSQLAVLSKPSAIAETMPPPSTINAPPPSPPKADDFAAVLARSMEQDESASPDVAYPSSGAQSKSYVPPKRSEPAPSTLGNAQRIEVSELGDSGADRARLLLRQGLSVEDVAKETGMGRGAVELLQQMIMRKR